MAHTKHRAHMADPAWFPGLSLPKKLFILLSLINPLEATYGILTEMNTDALNGFGSNLLGFSILY
ncbi:hypothetical protein CS542_10070 [Pedobacter sp. IW39]|nr:hypothetical protein CS542_10070 [Pedobacter sp. IW39]